MCILLHCLTVLHIFWGRLSISFGFPSALLCPHIRRKQHIICESLSCSCKDQHKFNQPPQPAYSLLYTLCIAQQSISKCYTSNPNFFKNYCTFSDPHQSPRNSMKSWNDSFDCPQGQRVTAATAYTFLICINVHTKCDCQDFQALCDTDRAEYQSTHCGSSHPTHRLEKRKSFSVIWTVSNSLFLFFSPSSVNSD